MYLGRVIGNVVSTIKHEDLKGHKLLLVEKLDEHLNGTGGTLVASDGIGAGNGEIVLYCTGGSARYIWGGHSPSDVCIVGVVESVEVN